MEIFVDKTIIKKFALLYLFQHLRFNWGSYLTSINYSMALIIEKGGWATLQNHQNGPGPKFKGLG